MPWYLYLALKQLFPSGRRVAFFTLASVAGVMLGVAVLIIVLSVMNGFGDEIREKIIETNGHVRVENGGVMFDQEAVMRQIREMPEVAAVAPYARGIVMLHEDVTADLSAIGAKSAEVLALWKQLQEAIL